MARERIFAGRCKARGNPVAGTPGSDFRARHGTAGRYQFQVGRRGRPGSQRPQKVIRKATRGIEGLGRGRTLPPSPFPPVLAFLRSFQGGERAFRPPRAIRDRSPNTRLDVKSDCAGLCSALASGRSCDDSGRHVVLLDDNYVSTVTDVGFQPNPAADTLASLYAWRPPREMRREVR